MGGDLCPYIENTLKTAEGQAAWDVLLKASRQLRLSALGGVIGLDLGVALRLSDSLGYDQSAMAELLPCAEQGLIMALMEKKENGE